MTARLSPNPVFAFRPDGSVFDLAAPHIEEVDFVAMAANLSKIARFNGTPRGLAYSVAQHSIMGAEAILQETGDQLLAALFLLHDGHEYLIGDITRPAQKLLAGVLEGEGKLTSIRFQAALDTIKFEWDMAIYAAAGLPTPEIWTNRQRDAVKAMDERMLQAEIAALFGHQAERNISGKPARPLKTRGAITPWPAMKAEEAFFTLLCRLIGEDRARDQAALSAIAQQPQHLLKQRIGI